MYQNQFSVFLAKIDQHPFFRSKASFSAKMDKNQFFHSKQPKPVCLAKIDQTQFCWWKPSFFGQNWPNPGFFGHNPVFSVKIDQNQFFFSQDQPTKTSFYKQKAFFLAKIDKTPFYRWKPSSTQIDPNHFFWPKLIKTSYFGQQPILSAKIDQTQFFGQIDQDQLFPSKPGFLAKTDQNQVFSVEINQNRKTKFSGQNWPKHSQTHIHSHPKLSLFSSVLILRLD